MSQLAPRLEAVMNELLTALPEVEAAAVVTVDGLPMASVLPSGMNEDRVAAMSAALLSLGERAAEGLGRGGLAQVSIEGEDGSVHLLAAGEDAVLVAVTGLGAKAGLILFELRRTCAALARELEQAIDEGLHAPGLGNGPVPVGAGDLDALTALATSAGINVPAQAAPVVAEPVYAAPAPVYAAPQPVQAAPEPVYAVPAPPAPTYLAPEPTPIAPEPAPAYVLPPHAAPLPTTVLPGQPAAAFDPLFGASSVPAESLAEPGHAEQPAAPAPQAPPSWPNWS